MAHSAGNESPSPPPDTRADADTSLWLLATERLSSVEDSTRRAQHPWDRFAPTRTAATFIERRPEGIALSSRDRPRNTSQNA